METGVENAGAAGGPQISTPAAEGAPPAKRLEIDLVGELSVRQGGEALALPRSRKCRALIAYLAATARPQRREHLCELLWEVPDDPRGSLRWSLSKIRRVLGDALVAEGELVSIDRRAVFIDAAELLDAAERLDTIATGDLERLARRCDQAFGRDLDLPRCPEFEGWLIAVREDVRQAQLAILAELVRRLADDPDRALPFARTRVACDPLDERARQDLLDVLAAAGRTDEAERQRRLAVDVLKDAGIAVPAGLSRPLRKPEAEAPRAAPLIQRIQFCTAPDGTRIAWSAVGTGPPIVKTANWMSHLEYEWESPLLRHWLVELSRQHSLIRYDCRGNGLSDRGAEDLSLDAFVQDLECVTGTIADEKFDLVGISQGAVFSIAFAVKHPEKVRKLVLFGGFAAGWRHSPSPELRAQRQAMVTLTEVGWGLNNPAFRQMFTSLFVPRATPEAADWFNELQRVSASPHEAQRLQLAVAEFDVRPLLARVRAPTIVFHSRDDAMVPFANGRQLASSIPGAEFVGLDSENHLLLEDEPAWAVFVDHLRDFLAR